MESTNNTNPAAVTLTKKSAEVHRIPSRTGKSEVVVSVERGLGEPVYGRLTRRFKGRNGNWVYDGGLPFDLAEIPALIEALDGIPELTRELGYYDDDWFTVETAMPVVSRLPIHEARA